MDQSDVDPVETSRKQLTCKREREKELLVFGVDEAGRGPLAGPVVVAAVCLPGKTRIHGVMDSKKIKSEDERRRLFNQIVGSDDCYWAVAVVDAQTIDEINILQATLYGMRSVLKAVCSSSTCHAVVRHNVSIDHPPGPYVVVSPSLTKPLDSLSCYAIIDGNQLPNDLPCRAEAMIKGDVREYVVSAASIIAKVTRDGLLHEYELRYGGYGFSQHKGYPTAAHVAALRKYGPTPIHRKSFEPVRQVCLASTQNSKSSKAKRKTVSRESNRRCSQQAVR
jgi:ribonuclease HII